MLRVAFEQIDQSGDRRAVMAVGELRGRGQVVRVVGVAALLRLGGQAGLKAFGPWNGIQPAVDIVEADDDLVIADGLDRAGRRLGLTEATTTRFGRRPTT